MFALSYNAPTLHQVSYVLLVEPGFSTVDMPDGTSKDHERGFGIQTLVARPRGHTLLDLHGFVRPRASAEDDETFVKRIQSTVLHVHGSQCDWYKWKMCNFSVFQCTAVCIGAWINTQHGSSHPFNVCMHSAVDDYNEVKEEGHPDRPVRYGSVKARIECDVDTFLNFKDYGGGRVLIDRIKNV
jgi:hypothetical protein